MRDRNSENIINNFLSNFYPKVKIKDWDVTVEDQEDNPDLSVIFTESGDLFKLKEIIEQLPLKNNFKCISMHDLGGNRHEGSKKWILEIDIKTKDAKILFLDTLKKLTLDFTAVPETATPQYPFFSSTNPKSVHKDNLDFVSSSDIAGTFDFDLQMITHLKKGLSKSIEIHTKDLETAALIGGKIRTKLEASNNRSYGGQLRHGGLFAKEPIIEISFDALEDLQKAITDHRSTIKGPD